MPRHLSAPVRTRPITQDELEQAKDAEIEEILAQAAIELQELVATDLAYARALAAADHTEALADEQLLAAEHDDYESGLTEMRLQREQGLRGGSDRILAVAGQQAELRHTHPT